MVSLTSHGRLWNSSLRIKPPQGMLYILYYPSWHDAPVGVGTNKIEKKKFNVSQLIATQSLSIIEILKQKSLVKGKRVSVP